MNKIIRYLKLAATTAVSKEDIRTFLLGAIAIRNDGTIVKAVNGPTAVPTRQAHAEYRLSRKIDTDAIVFVARVRRDESLGMARPCKNCIKVLRSKRVQKVYYSISDNEYGVINFVSDNEYNDFINI